MERYELVRLVLEFLISALVLAGGFLILVVYRDPNVSSGVVALVTLVITYWFGRTRRA